MCIEMFAITILMKKQLCQIKQIHYFFINRLVVYNLDSVLCVINYSININPYITQLRDYIWGNEHNYYSLISLSGIQL